MTLPGAMDITVFLGTLVYVTWMLTTYRTMCQSLSQEECAKKKDNIIYAVSKI